MTGAEYECKFEPTKDAPYLALTGEVWGVFCDDFEENRLCYNGTTLYVLNHFELSGIHGSKDIS